MCLSVATIPIVTERILNEFKPVSNYFAILFISRLAIQNTTVIQNHLRANGQINWQAIINFISLGVLPNYLLCFEVSVVSIESICLIVAICNLIASCSYIVLSYTNKKDNLIDSKSIKYAKYYQASVNTLCILIIIWKVT